MIKVTYRNKQYDSLKDLCNDTEANPNGLEYNTVRQRLIKNGGDLEAALAELKRVKFNGAERSLVELCKDSQVNIHGLTYSAVSSRISRGESVEDAFRNRPARRPILDKEQLKLNGKQYNNLKELAINNDIGMGYQALAKRVKSGVGIEEAINNGLNCVTGDEYSGVGNYYSKDSHGKVKIFNKEYRSVAEAAKALGLRAEDLLKDTHKYKSIEDRVIFLLSRGVTVNEVKYPNLTQACVSYNTHYRAVWARIQGGWTVQEALETPIRESNAKIKAKIWIDGQLYEGINSALTAIGVSEALYHRTKGRLLGRVKNVTPSDSLQVLRTYKHIVKDGSLTDRIPWITINGVKFYSKDDLATRLGINAIKFKSRSRGIEKGDKIEITLKTLRSFGINVTKDKGITIDNMKIYCGCIDRVIKVIEKREGTNK